jgi:hypothetical protein
MSEKVTNAKAATVADYDERELSRAQTLIGGLLETHWAGIQGAIVRSGDGEGSVSISLKLDHTGPVREIKCKIGYAIRTTDEAEAVVRDPRQMEMPL